MLDIAGLVFVQSKTRSNENLPLTSTIVSIPVKLSVARLAPSTACLTVGSGFSGESRKNKTGDKSKMTVTLYGGGPWCQSQLQIQLCLLMWQLLMGNITCVYLLSSLRRRSL